MLEIFNPKVFLIDYLKNFIDIHNHILPGIDDGSPSVAKSIELLKGFSELNVRNFICTPHIMHDYYPNTPKSINKSFTKLKNELSIAGMTNITISVAAEHMIDNNFDGILFSNNIMPMKEHYLLIEMSFLQPPIHFNSSIENIKSKGLFPILAHPERYIFLHQNWKKYLPFKESNIQFQLNLLSLGGYYGKNVHSMALKLLQNNLIDYVATDIHNMQQLNFLKNIRITKKTVNILLPIINRTIDTFY